MFGFIKKMFIEWLHVCTIGSFAESLVSNLKELRKYLTLYNPPCKLDQHLLI